MAYEESQSGPSDCGSPYLEGTAKETKVDVASAWKNIKRLSQLGPFEADSSSLLATAWFAFWFSSLFLFLGGQRWSDGLSQAVTLRDPKDPRGRVSPASRGTR